MRFLFFVRDSDETPKLNLTSRFVLPTHVFKAFGRSNVMVNTRECHAKPKMKSVWSSRKEMRNQKLETRIKAKLFKMEAPNYGENLIAQINNAWMSRSRGVKRKDTLRATLQPYSLKS